MRPVAVLTGIESEARLLPGVRVALSAADPVQAERQAAALVAEGVAALVSFGLAGGLADGLPPGTLLVPETVRCNDGTAIAADPDWRDTVRYALERNGMTVHGGAIAAAAAVVPTPDAKRALAIRSGAVAVDMESGAVARAGVPFVVLRAVADPAHRAIPPAALAGVGPGGRVRAVPVLVRLLAAPRQIPALLRLAADSRAGLAALAAAVAALGSLEPPPHNAPPERQTGA